MAQIELVCTEVECQHNDGAQNCALDTVTLGAEGQCEDYEAED